MLRSKYHHPWQPRVSDSQTFNPYAKATETEVSLSAQLEELEEEAHTPMAAQGDSSVDRGSPAECLQAPAPVALEAAAGQSNWYERLVKRFTKH